MFRMWGKLMKDNHLLKDTVVCISNYSLSRTQMVFDSWILFVMNLIWKNPSGWTLP